MTFGHVLGQFFFGFLSLCVRKIPVSLTDFLKEREREREREENKQICCSLICERKKKKKRTKKEETTPPRQ